LENTTRRDRWKAILKMAWPLIIANSFWNLQLTVDRIFLGQYSTEALAAAMTVKPTPFNTCVLSVCF
jgi:MATE family multidrug resistance protein